MSRRERRALERETRERQPTGSRSAGSTSRRPAWRSPIALVSAGAVLVAAIAIIAAGGLPGGSSTAAEVSPPMRLTVPPDVTAEGEAIGPADAPAQLVVYNDFQCPACKLLAEDYLPRLTREFAVTGDLRLEDRAIAILGRGSPDESVESAVGASCAGDQNRYWDYHDWLFANQAGENRGAFNRENLEAIADGLGLNRAAWDACMDDPSRAAAVTSTTSQALGLGINSTPTLELNGERIVGVPQSYDALAAAVRAIIDAGAP